MTELPVWAYAAIFIATAFTSTILVPVAIRAAIGWGLLDLPGGYKAHEEPVPLFGGAAIIGTFCLAVVAAAAVWRPVAGFGELALIVGLAVFLAAVGLVDDGRGRGLGLTVRVVCQVAAGAALLWGDIGASLFGNPVADGLLTIAWVVGITNAFNLLDNIDGLSAGIAAIGAGWLWLIAALNGQFLVAALSIALAGCAIGFLRHNRHPARIYMGDSGALFLGFLLAVLGLKLRFNAPPEVTAFVPVLVLAIPILDTATVAVARLTHGRNPLTGARDHLSHRLVFVGLSVPTSVQLLYAAAIACGWSALVMSRLDVATAYLLLALVATALAAAAIVLGRVPVYPNSRRRKIMLQAVEGYEEEVAPEAEAS